MPRTRATRASVLTGEWCAWIAENVVSGVGARSIVSTLVKSGVPRALATRAVKDIQGLPALHGVLAGLRYKRAAELRARSARELLATRTIERRPKPSAAEFFDRYWATGTPVIFTDATTGWKLWTPAIMKRLFGAAPIDVTDGREADPHYDERFAAHVRKTTMGAFVDRVMAAPATNDFYMVAQSKTMERPPFRALLRRIVIDEELFDPSRIAGATSLWFGPKGTVTPLHHDGTNIFFAQIYGRKQFLLASPNETRILDSARGYYAKIDPEAPDLERWPWWSEVALHKVVLSPGEVLFLPVGWWHHVRSLDVSISLSLLNFRRPNSFEWYKPGFAETTNGKRAKPKRGAPSGLMPS